MRKLVIFVAFFCFYLSKAQNEISIIDIIKKIENQKEVDSLQLLYPELSILRHTLSIEDENLNKLVSSLKDNQIETLPNGNGYIKLLNKKYITQFKVKYIFINGKELNQKEIEDIQYEIFKELNSGKTFSEVANKYTMDPGSKDGDLGWFPEGRMIKSFEKAIREHKKGETFTVSEPSRKWLFVIFKNHDERELEIYEYITVTNH